MINCNPETVSTDYDTSDRLYFEPLTFEDVWAIYQHETSKGAECGVIVQFGGQTPLNLALPLKKAGVKIIGTSPESIDLAEDRKQFNKLLEDEYSSGSRRDGDFDRRSRGRREADWLSRASAAFPMCSADAPWSSLTTSNPSFAICRRQSSIRTTGRCQIDHFLEDAIEVDVDALSDGEDVVIGGIMQHIEEAGIRAGDSSCVLPAADIPQHLLEPHA